MITEQWNQDPEFQSLPDERKIGILSNYFNDEMADDEFRALPEPDQERIMNNFLSSEGFKIPVNPDLTLGRLGSQAYRGAAQGLADQAHGIIAEERQKDPLADEQMFQATGLDKLSPVERGLFGPTVSDATTLKGSPLDEQEISELRVAFKTNRSKEYIEKLSSFAKSLPKPLPGSSGIIEDAVGGVSRFGPGMLLTAVNAPAGTISMFNQIYGQKYNELTEGGIDHDTAREVALLTSSINTPLEQAGSLFQIKMLKKLFSNVGAKAGLGKRLRQFIGVLVANVSGEGLEEYLQQYPDEIANIYAANYDKSGKEIASEVLKQLPRISESAKQAMKVGAVGGLIMTGGVQAVGAPFNIADYRAEKEAERNENLVNQYEEASEEDILGDKADNIAKKIIDKIAQGGPVRTKQPTVDEIKQAEELREIERQQTVEANKPDEWKMPLEEWLAKEGLNENVLKTYPVSSLETMVKKHAGIVQGAVDQGLRVPQEVIDSVNQPVGVMTTPIRPEIAPAPEKTDVALEGTGATTEQQSRPTEPEFTVPKPKKGVYTLGGELKSMNGLDRRTTLDAMGKSNINDLPLSVKMLIKNGGEKFDLAQDRLKEAGYLQQNEALADVMWAEPDILKRRNASDLEQTEFAERIEEAPVEVLEENLESQLSEIERTHKEAGTDISEDPQAKAIADTFLVIDRAREAEEAGNGKEYDKLYGEVEKRISDIQSMGDTSFDVGAIEGRRQEQAQFEGIEKRREEDRRRDEISRKKVAEMVPEEKDLMLLTDKLTGLPNRRAYDESVKKPVQGFFDLDVFKNINDTHGHHVGDRVLRRVADAFRSAAAEAYRIGGDEYVLQADNEINIDNIAKKAYDYLEKNPVNVREPGKPVNPIIIGFSYGKGTDIKKAEKALQAHKTERKRLGKRWERNEKPESISGRLPEGDRDIDRRGSDRSEKLTPTSEAAESTKKETKPETPEKKEAVKETPQAQPTAKETVTPEMGKGLEYEYDVQVKESGEVLKISEDAEQALKNIDEQILSYKILRDCI